MANSAKSADLEAWFKPCTDKILELAKQQLDDLNTMMFDSESRIEVSSITVPLYTCADISLDRGGCGWVQ